MIETQHGKKSRAFVISPIGGVDENGKDIRRAYADKVFTQIIEPACRDLRTEGLDVRPIRGEQDRDQADIIKRFLDAINEYEVVIALLSEADISHINANVFYELGIAHAAGRPVILLRHKNQPLPFDILTKDCIEYTDAHLTGTQDPMQDGGPAQQVRDEILKRLKSKNYYEPPFARDLSLGRQGVRNRQNSVTFEEWSRMILSADEEVWLAGTTLLWLAEKRVGSHFFMPSKDNSEALTVQAHVSTLLADRINYGVNVTILINHPDNPFMHIVNAEAKDETAEQVSDNLRTIRDEAAKSFALWQRHRDAALRLAQEARASGEGPSDIPLGQFRIIQVRRNAVLHRISATEKRALLTPNFYHIGYNTGPCIDARPDSGASYEKAAFKYILEDLRHLADLNEGLSDTALPDPAVQDNTAPNGTKGQWGFLGRLLERASGG